MRYNPTKDCSTYFEWPNPWDIKPWFSEPPKRKNKPKVLKQWEEEPNEGKQETIPYWRDIEKAFNKPITSTDMQFRNWPTHRRKDPLTTWLPAQHCYGGRFIKLTMGFPLGWRYRYTPMNLSEVRKVIKAEKVREQNELKQNKESQKPIARRTKRNVGTKRENQNFRKEF